MHGFGTLGFGAQTAQHIDGGGMRELRGAESGDEHAAADPAVLFHGLERWIDRGVAARDVLRKRGFTHHDAVARQQLLRGDWRSIPWA